MKLRCFWPPTTNEPMTDAEILSMADMEILGSCWPRLIAAQADYFLSAVDHQITSGYSRYRLPKRAFGPIKDVLWCDDSNPEDDNFESVTFVNIEELGHMRGGRSTRGGYVAYIDGDYLGIYPTPNSTRGTLRIRYYRAPNALCLASAASTIESINLDTDPDLFIVESQAFAGTLSQGDLVDVIGAGNAHQILCDGIEVDAISLGEITFTESIAGSGAQIGDYVAESGQTPIVQLPDFMIPALSQHIAGQALSAFGDRDAAKAAMGEAQRLSQLADQTLSPRSEAEPLTVSPRFSTLHLARGGGGSWR